MYTFHIIWVSGEGQVLQKTLIHFFYEARVFQTVTSEIQKLYYYCHIDLTQLSSN